MPSEFVHLHLHTQYSLLDGAIRLPQVFGRLKALDMDACAITDNGNMFGAVDFFNGAKKSGIKPILGCEIHVCEDMDERGDRRTAHLVLLCKDLEGWLNLSYMVSEAHLRGFYYVPRIDRKLLAAHSKGLFGLSACLGGVVNRAWRGGGESAARAAAETYRDLFEPGQFYLEVIANRSPEQDEANERLRRLGAELGIPLVATADCHYMTREDARAHDVLMAIQSGRTLDDPNRMRHPTDELYIKSEAEMREALPGFEDAIANTRRIAEQCDVKLDLGNTYLPKFQVPAGFADATSYFEQIVKDGLEKRLAVLPYAFDRKVYEERRDYELGVIKRMGFEGYFLIVWDFINWAKEHGIPVGPGRGSGAGSLVAWSMRITDLDPIYYNLLFERFLNPERVSMPDFDIDFCEYRRGEVIDYVTQKYGEQNVAKIVTFGKLKAKAVLKDVGRALGLPFSETDRISKLVPNVLNITLQDALDQEPRLRELGEERPVYKELIDYALGLEGLYRHAGVHAAGIVIGEKPIWHYSPLCKDPDGARVTQFDKDMVEQAGLVKFDFLGLSTLTLIDGAVRRVNEHRPAEQQLDIGAISLTDAGVYKMLAAGESVGVFQLESTGFQALLQKLKPDCFEDIVAAVALYRPGPLQSGVVDLFIDSKHGRIPIPSLHPDADDILRETYGVIVYQEQVMRISQALGQFTQGEADTLRKAMGKKKADLMAKLREQFVKGAVGRGIEEKQAVEIADLIEKFGGYGFNKSHSAAYALVTYQTAWLKHHQPREFFASLLTIEKDSSDKLAQYIGEARRMGIRVLPPSVNLSDSEFTVVGDDIRFGLAAIKNVGGNAVEAIVQARGERGPFKGLFDFCERVDLKSVNKRVVESLVRTGAFDFTGRTRRAMFEAIDTAFERGQGAQKDRARGQATLFGMLEAAAGPKAGPAAGEPYEDKEEWDERSFLGGEKELLGVYITRHPLSAFESELGRYASRQIREVHELNERSEVTLAGLVTGLRERPLKNGGGRMAVLTLEDLTGSVEAVCYARTWAEVEATARRGEPLVVAGRVRHDQRGNAEDDSGGQRTATVIVDRIQLLSDARRESTRRVELRLKGDAVPAEHLRKLRSVLEMHRGEVPVALYLDFPLAEAVVALPASFGVALSDDLIVRTKRLLGAESVVLR